VKTYLVFEPSPGGRTPGTAERIVFVRDKFYWSALFFAPLWLLLNRLWLGFVFWCAAEALILTGVKMLELGPVGSALALVVPSLIVAWEGTQLKTFKLLHKNFREVDVVIAADLAAAERRFFERWNKPAERAIFSSPPAPPSTPATLPEKPRSSNPVLGLFPEPWRSR
jgi:hypothetical protein